MALFVLPPAVILPYGGATAPEGFLMCDGALANRTTYAALYAQVGFDYSPVPGVDPGSNQFYLPNLNGRVPVGQGLHADVNARGKSEGLSEPARRPTHKHSIQNASIGDHSHTIPAHSHTVNSHSHTVDSHTHTVTAHSHIVDAHSHTVNSHSHTVNAHDHGGGNHGHSNSFGLSHNWTTAGGHTPISTANGPDVTNSVSISASGVIISSESPGTSASAPGTSAVSPSTSSASPVTTAAAPGTSSVSPGTNAVALTTSVAGGTLSGGTVGPQTGNEPTDTVAYLVVRYIIKY
jgi:microcystin-dependent protein